MIGGDSCNNGDFGNQGLFDADIVNIDGTAGSNHPLSNISSNSWGPGDDTQPAILTNIMHAYLVRAAAQGVGMYFASGDSSGVETPDDPFTILVGGTSLGIGSHGQRLFETGWSSGRSEIQNGTWVLEGEDGASSGGPSLIWPAARLPARRGAEGAWPSRIPAAAWAWSGPNLTWPPTRICSPGSPPGSCRSRRASRRSSAR